MPLPRTRLAPSPTGALHLGNARTFLVTWALARQLGWQIVLRIEDLDGPRIKSGADAEAIELFEWLGIDWDEGPYYQLRDLNPYQVALEQLAAQGDLYPCRCTRSQIEAASLSAPHGDEHELRYPGTCRPDSPVPLAWNAAGATEMALRFRVPQEELNFDDQFAGPQTWDVASSVGDFLVRTKGNLPSYQLAVVVDDLRQGITQVIRGDDLLSSTPRQLLLYDKLGLARVPTYTHLPLVVGQDGRRLAKRHGDSRLSHFRALGVSAERVIGLLAQWCGLEAQTEMSSAEFAEQFCLDTLPREKTVFTPADEAWLCEKA